MFKRLLVFMALFVAFAVPAHAYDVSGRTWQEAFQTAATATGAGSSYGAGGLSTITVSITGITTATITFEGTVDDTTWVSIGATNSATGAIATTATANGIYVLPVAGYSQVRCRISAYTSGTISALGEGTIAPSGVVQANETSGGSLPAGSATAANQTNVQSAPGTPQTTANTIQGNASGIPLPITGTIAATQSGVWQVVGNVASLSADSGNPIKMGGVYNTSSPAPTNGQRIDMQMDGLGDVNVNLKTALAGEDLTNNVLGIVVKPILASTYSFLWDIAIQSAVTHNSKATAGLLESISVSNSNTAIRYLQFYNSTGSTSGTPVLCFAIPGGSATMPGTINLDTTQFGNGVWFSTGITWADSTTASTYTAGSSTDFIFNEAYL